MTKADIVKRIEKELYVTSQKASDMLEHFLEIVKQTLEAGEPLKISGFGSFDVKSKAPRRGRNPVTGEAITLEGRKILRFKPSSVLKQSINT